jgi:DNA-binding SARP family transcriptional activator
MFGFVKLGKSRRKTNVKNTRRRYTEAAIKAYVGGAEVASSVGASDHVEQYILRFHILFPFRPVSGVSMFLVDFNPNIFYLNLITSLL